MATYYRIVDWDRHYEVDDRGHAWKDGKAFRHGPLEYVRVKARGRDFSRSALALSDLAGESMYFALGVFQKIAEIVARAPRYLREGGVVRNRKGEPATVEEIAWMLRVKIDTLRESLRLLTHPEVAWLEEVTEACLQVPGIPGIPGNSGSPGNSGNFGNRSDKSSQSQDKTIDKSSQSQGPGFSLQPSESPSADDSHDLLLKAGFDSTRLGFLRDLRVTLRANTNSDHQAIINFEGWLHDQIVRGCAGDGDRAERLTRVMWLARDCKNGDAPIAVFMSRVRSELGYIPPSRRAERMDV